MSRWFRTLAVGLVAAAPISLYAQTKVPTTPRECVEELRAFRMQEIFAVGYFDAPYIDKHAIEQKVSVKALDCTARFPIADTKGKQLDALAQIYVINHKDDVGRELFAKRLAEPGITVREKGLALAAAVTSFSDADYPARIEFAEKYMQDLDALGPEVAKEASGAHATLANTFRLVKNEAKQVQHGETAINIAQKLTVQERYQLLDDLINTYGDLSEAYVQHPDSKAKLDAMSKVLTNPTVVDNPMVKMGLQRAVERGYMLGKTAPDLFANHWFNREAPPNNTLSVKGNVPHVVEFTAFG